MHLQDLRLGSGVRLLFPFAALFGLVLTASPVSADGSLSVGTCTRDITPISPGLAAAYETAFGNDNDIILLSPDSDFYKFFKDSELQ